MGQNCTKFEAWKHTKHGKLNKQLYKHINPSIVHFNLNWHVSPSHVYVPIQISSVQKLPKSTKHFGTIFSWPITTPKGSQLSIGTYQGKIARHQYLHLVVHLPLLTLSNNIPLRETKPKHSCSIYYLGHVSSWAWCTSAYELLSQTNRPRIRGTQVK